VEFVTGAATVATYSKPLALPLGALGVLAFSLTLPATRVADPAFGGWTAAFGRAVLAALVGAILLAVKREPLLMPRHELRSMLVVVGGVVVGFPLFTSLALESVDSAHGAVVTGLIPAATAGFAVLLAGERPRRSYWLALAIGLLGVLSLPVIEGHGQLKLGDLFLLLAVVVAGLGYAKGGMLARAYGGWRVICWAVILSLPAMVPLTVLSMALRPPRDVTGHAVLGMAYLGIVSMCLGFCAWYEGLARGGIARIGRIQLAQPVLTLAWSVLLLGEHLTAITWIAAAVVLAAVAVGRNARVDSTQQPTTETALATDRA
jgi:drug/metabolite transporter (DMT)-like permease